LPRPELARQLPVDIVCDGVISRSVRDTAHFYAQAEQLFVTKLPPIGLVEGASNTRLRIGMVLDSVEADPTDAATRAAVLLVSRPALTGGLALATAGVLCAELLRRSVSARGHSHAPRRSTGRIEVTYPPEHRTYPSPTAVPHTQGRSG
jgi:hypothetical protein